MAIAGAVYCLVVPTVLLLYCILICTCFDELIDDKMRTQKAIKIMTLHLVI